MISIEIISSICIIEVYSIQVSLIFGKVSVKMRYFRIFLGMALLL